MANEDDIMSLEDERDQYNSFKPRIGGGEPIDPRKSSVLIGYGNTLIRSTPEGWVGLGGEKVTDAEAREVHEELLRRRKEDWNTQAEETRKEKMPAKPSEKELAIYDQWKKVEEHARKEIGIDPDEVHRTSKRDYKDSILSKYPLSSRSLIPPKELAKLEEESIKYADSKRDKALAEINHQLSSFVKPAFDKVIAQQETLRKEAAKRALEKTPWKLEDTETGLRQYIRVSPSGDVEIKPTNIPNVKDVTANKRTAQSKILRDVGGVLKASVDENGNPVEIDPGTLALIQQRLEEAELPPVKPKYEEPTGVKKMFGLEKKFKGYAFEGEAVEKQGDYSSAEDVRTAYKTGKISKEEAKKIIQSKGWKVN
jgi:hypothetical protein